LLENIRLFREHPDVLRQYQNRFKFILVDEYQDTNVAQYLWLRLLSQAPAKPGVALAAIIPGYADSPVIPGRIEDANPESGAEDEPHRDSGFAPDGAPRNDGAPVIAPPPSPTSAASATTTSRSMAGAAPRSITSCASITIFPEPRSFGWNATTAPPDTSSPPRHI
jgi:DNA helicase-2/ATP-dependent DNA helicase PcrA